MCFPPGQQPDNDAHEQQPPWCYEPPPGPPPQMIPAQILPNSVDPASSQGMALPANIQLAPPVYIPKARVHAVNYMRPASYSGPLELPHLCSTPPPPKPTRIQGQEIIRTPAVFPRQPTAEWYSHALLSQEKQINAAMPQQQTSVAVAHYLMPPVQQTPPPSPTLHTRTRRVLPMGDPDPTPCVGAPYDSVDRMQADMNRYGLEVGHCFTRKSHGRGVFQMRCALYDKALLKRYSKIYPNARKRRCPWEGLATQYSDAKWRLNSINPQHNHPPSNELAQLARHRIPVGSEPIESAQTEIPLWAAAPKTYRVRINGLDYSHTISSVMRLLNKILLSMGSDSRDSPVENIKLQKVCPMITATVLVSDPVAVPQLIAALDGHTIEGHNIYCTAIDNV